MKTPKLLPWYARKAGVSTERATVLWRTAIREATEKTGWVANTEYWGEAMHCFHELLEREQRSLCAPDVTSLLRTQNRLWGLPLTAMEDVFTAVSVNWRRQTNWQRDITSTPQRAA